MRKKETLLLKIWDIVYPLGMYYVTIVIAMFAAQCVLGSDSSRYMLCQIIASAVALPVVYLSFYRPDLRLSGGKTLRQCGGRRMAGTLLWVAAVTLFISVGLNNLITMSPLISVSEGYAAASEDFYGGSLLPELIGSAFLTPILEETLYRGVLYRRLREMTGVLPSVAISALIFGFMHFNLVQFVYAFLLGIALALFAELAGHVYAAVAAHILANLVAVIRTETGILSGTADGSAFAWGISIAALAAGIGLFAVWLIKAKKRGNAEIQFRHN